MSKTLKKGLSLIVISLFILSCLASIIPQTQAVVLSGSGSINLISNSTIWWQDTPGETNIQLTTFDGRPCWRVTQPSDVLAIDAGPFDVVPGDRVVFVSQIQVTSSTDSTAYACLGIDLVGSNMTEYLSPSYGTGNQDMTGNYYQDPQGIIDENVVQGTSAWTQKYIDGYVQASYTANQPGYGTVVDGVAVGTSFVPYGIQNWCMVSNATGSTHMDVTAYFSYIGVFVISVDDPAYTEPISYFENIAQSTSPGTTVSPTPTATVAPTASSQTVYSAAPTATLATYLIFCTAMFALAMLAYILNAKLGLFFGIIGLVGTVFFASAGALIVAQSTNPITLVTTIELMPIGWFLLFPIVLSFLNFAMILLAPKIDRSRGKE